MQLCIYAQYTRSDEARRWLVKRERERKTAWVKYPKYRRRGISTWTYRGRASRKLADIRARVARRILLITLAPIEPASICATHKRLENGRPF